MAHSIQALVIGEASNALALAEVPSSRPIPIGHGLSLVPITDAALDALRERFPDLEDPSEPAFWKLSGPLVRVAERLSEFGPIAYIETEYFAVWASKLPPFGNPATCECRP